MTGKMSFSLFLLITGQKKSRERSDLCPVTRLVAVLRLLSSRAVPSANKQDYCNMYL
jgi:hypothetical protein